jgi:DNA-binding transcriptional LysR family regulator
LNRTSRSVTLTAAGEALQSALVRPFDEINSALDVLNRFRDTPTGRVRLSVPTEAAQFLIGPVMATFLDRYPEIEIEFSVNNRMIDVVESGFDAGIRYGGTVPQDMIAQRLSADIRWLVVGAPSYFERYGAPVHPNDLQAHRCVRIRTGDDRVYRWEFEKRGKPLTVSVSGPLIVNDAEFMIRAAVDGVGLAYSLEQYAAEHIARGRLVRVLEDWCPPFDGYFLYYPSRRHQPRALQALVDALRV